MAMTKNNTTFWNATKLLPHGTGSCFSIIRVHKSK